MASAMPVIQVLSKNNYQDQHIISLPNAFPLPALASASIRIKSTILSLTTNTFTYARLGHLLGWWDVHLLPPSIPAEFSDPKKFGRVSAWGYAEVLESNASGIEEGTQFYGYLPIGTLPLDIEVKPNPKGPSQFFEVSKQREKLWPVYNRYIFDPQNPKEVREKESLGWDVLMLILFQTGYMTNRYVLALEPSKLVYPSGDSKDGWTFQHGALDDNSIIIGFAASGKTAIRLAYSLKHDRPAGKKPRTVVGVGSVSSKAFTEGTGLYDKVLTYDADSGGLGHQLGLKPDTKIVVSDFGARDGAADRDTKKFLVRLKADGYKAGVNASSVRAQAMDLVGEQKYFDDFAKLWDSVRRGG